MALVPVCSKCGKRSKTSTVHRNGRDGAIIIWIFCTNVTNKNKKKKIAGCDAAHRWRVAHMAGI